MNTHVANDGTEIVKKAFATQRRTMHTVVCRFDSNDGGDIIFVFSTSRVYYQFAYIVDYKMWLIYDLITINKSTCYGTDGDKYLHDTLIDYCTNNNILYAYVKNFSVLHREGYRKHLIQQLAGKL